MSKSEKREISTLMMASIAWGDGETIDSQVEKAKRAQRRTLSLKFKREG